MPDVYGQVILAWIDEDGKDDMKFQFYNFTVSSMAIGLIKR